MSRNTDKLDEFREKVSELLMGYRWRKVGDAKLYFIDRRGNETLKRLDGEFNGAPSSSKKERKEFAQIVNHLNPDVAAYTYYVGLRGKHRQITHKESTQKYIQGEFAVWKNIQLKNAKEMVATHSLQDEAVDRLNAEVNSTIEVARQELEYIMSNDDKIIVKIAGFTHQIIYPYVQYGIDNEGKRKHQNKHLSIQAPNALFYQPATFRRDMKIDDFIKLARNPFGDVYYMERTDEEN